MRFNLFAFGASMVSVQAFLKDVQTTFTGLLVGPLIKDFIGKSFDLDIHLAGGNTVCGTGYFKVHITQVILITKDITQSTAYLPVSASEISPIAIPETGLVICTPASISAIVPEQTVAIEDEPLLSNTSETTRTV